MVEGVWEAARCVRPYLTELLGAVLAAEVDAQLARLLNGGDGDLEDRLRELFSAHEATIAFLDRVAGEWPEVVSVRAGTAVQNVHTSPPYRGDTSGGQGRSGRYTGPPSIRRGWKVGLQTCPLRPLNSGRGSLFRARALPPVAHDLQGCRR